MDNTDAFWQKFNQTITPTKAEIVALDIVEGMPDNLFADYVQVQTLYRMILVPYFFEIMQLDILDQRLAERGYKTVLEKDFYQKYDLMELNYVFLRSFIHVERLSETEILLFRKCIEERSEHLLRQAFQIVHATYQQVLALKPNWSDRQIEVQPSLYGEYQYTGDTILFGLASAAAYDEEGMLQSSKKEDERVRTFLSIQKQMEAQCKSVLGIPVRFLVMI